MGSISAKLLEEAGCTVVAVSEDYGGIYNPLGLSIKRVLEYRAREKTLRGFPGAQEIGNQELLGVDCDLLVPAAIGNQLRVRTGRQPPRRTRSFASATSSWSRTSSRTQAA